jgi:hypothetical protein
MRVSSSAVMPARVDRLPVRGLYHPRRGIDADDAVALDREQYGQRSGAASEIGHIDGRLAKDRAQQLTPCVPYHRIA